MQNSTTRGQTPSSLLHWLSGITPNCLTALSSFTPNTYQITRTWIIPTGMPWWMKLKCSQCDRKRKFFVLYCLRMKSTLIWTPKQKYHNLYLHRFVPKIIGRDLCPILYHILKVSMAIQAPTKICALLQLRTYLLYSKIKTLALSQILRCFSLVLTCHNSATDEKDILTKPFTFEEFNNIVTCMPSGKSNGKDNIPIDIFKNSTELCSILVACANLITRSKKVNHYRNPCAQFSFD